MSLPWFPLYVNDLMLSTSEMSTSCFGAYMRLLCYAWAGNGIPNDFDMCVRITGGMTAQEWSIIRKRLEVVENAETGEQRLIHPRMERERERVGAVRSKRREAAAKTNEKRWGTTNAGIGDRVADRVGDRVGQRSYPQPHSQSQRTDRTADAVAQVQRAQHKRSK
jgi:uncharacterized protein YdaU (DUF1376 family)